MHRTHSSRLPILAAALALAGVGLSAWAASALVKPANVGARTGDGAATLSWDAVAGATGYQYRQRKAEDDAYGAWIPTATSTAATHTVTPLRNGATYSFQVRAVRGTENGPASDAVTTTLLTAPAGLTATPSDGRVTLAWQAVAGATGYQHRKRKSHDADHEAWAAIATATSTTHAVTPLRNGTAYSFQVRAVRGADRGPASAGVAAAPFAPCGGEAVKADLVKDCETLLAAKATLDPGGSLNWARSRALGEWHGVTVSAGRVTRLSCPAGGLAGGQLADSLGRLTGLTHIDLSECGLEGGIPSSLASLRNLEVLFVHRNKLSGGIPDLRRLSKLKWLSFTRNKLTGPIPPWLGSLVNLEQLHLGINGFSGTMPALGGLVKLKGLGIHNLKNLSEGPIPAWVGSLVNLEHLSLGKSNRTGAVPALDRLTKLRRIWLAENKLTDISALAPLVNLELLAAYDNNLSGDLPDLSRLTKLKKLQLSHNKLTGDIPPWLGTFVHLEVLDLSMNGFSGTLPALGRLVKLKWLGLSHLPDLAEGPIPTWVGSLVNLGGVSFRNSNRTGAVPPLNRLTKLQGVWLAENKLTGISALAPLVNLEVLSARDNNLSGDLPDLSRLTKMKTLDLADNDLTGAVPPWLGSFVNLEYLVLDENGFNGGLPALGGLVKLRTLRLHRLTKLDEGPIPAWMGSLVNLENLVIGKSNLTGAVPPLNRLTKLRSLHLAENELTSISALASLVNLESLVAYDNNLSGRIPNLGQLSKLKVLSLTRNKLTGAIPPWLGSLVNLEELYLGNNGFSGTLPALGGLVKLRGLGLEHLTKLDEGPIPAWVGSLVNLEDLVFSKSKRTGTVPPLSRLTKLRRVWLEENKLRDISALAPLVNLEVLIAYRNELSGGVPDLSRLSKLKVLSLTRNKLIGPVPPWLGSLVNLEELYLGMNDLIGTLPALGGLVKLRMLGLHNLNLTEGPIPTWVGSLVNLEQLSLGKSNFTGAVPPLSRLTKLRRVWLPKNKLTDISALAPFANLEKLHARENLLTGCIPRSLASHVGTINPQKNGANLSLCPASDATSLASDAVVPAVAVAARDERATRRGLSRIVPLTPSPRRHGRDNGRARWPAPSEAAFGTFRSKTPNPMPDLYLAPSGESVALALSCFLPVDRLGARPHAAYAATSTATELATAATVGDQLILTPNQFGLEGELAVVVTRLGRQSGASARLRVVVRSHAPPDNARWRVSAPGAACATTSPGREPRARSPG